MRWIIFWIFFILIWGVSCSDKPSSQEGASDVTPLSSTPEADVSCSQHFECEKQCSSLFRSQEQKDQCMKWSAETIRQLYTALEENLKTPIRSLDLNKIKEELFTTIVNTSSLYWYRNIRNYTQEDGRKVLNWLVSKPVYTRLILDSQQERADKIFPNLIESLNNQTEQALLVSLGSENFMIQAVRTNNNRAFEWAHQFAVRKCSDSLYSRYSPRADRACVLGNLYCVDQGRTFSEIYPKIVENDAWLGEFIQLRRPKGLHISSDDSQNLSVVCRRFCSENPESPVC